MKSTERKIKLKDVTAEVAGSLVRIKGPKGAVERRFKEKSIVISKEGDFIVIKALNSKRKCKRVMSTTTAHIKNMIKGASEGYEYRLKICSSHFPMNVSVSGKDIIVKNFLGEKNPRICKIRGDVGIKLERDSITLTGIDKETVGQAAADLEQKISIRNKDRRIFMDGIYIVSKG
jgi:large subunit ribosomal protein L6